MGRNFFLLCAALSLGATSLCAVLTIEGWPVDWVFAKHLLDDSTPVDPLKMDFCAPHLQGKASGVLWGPLKPLYIAYRVTGDDHCLAICQTMCAAAKILQECGDDKTVQWAYIGMVVKVELNERGRIQQLHLEAEDYHRQMKSIEMPGLQPESGATFDPDAFLTIPEDGFRAPGKQ